MLKTFMLIAILTASNGEAHEFVIDHSLSQTDCQAALEAGLKFDGPPTRRLQDAALECREETT